MRRLLERCAALDVHRASVTVCVHVPGEQEQRSELVREFSAMTPDLLALRDWLGELGVTEVAMEATGVYWKPVYYLLEEEFECLLVNAQHVKRVPGRKTDVSDAQWLCELLEHGLLKPSFVPPKPIRQLRDLTRYRKTLVRERAREANRLHKLLEDAGIKLACVASDVLGASGRAMLDALIAGESEPARLAELAKGKLRRKRPELERALQGRFERHHALLAGQILDHIDYLGHAIDSLNQAVEAQIAPFAAAVELLDTITGVGRRSAEVIIAELGTDMERFPSADHLASWAKLCPGNDQSAGKRRSGRTGHGDSWLRETLVECSWAAIRREGYLRSQFLQLRRRRGERRAIIAVAHSLLVIVYHVLKHGRAYHDLGADWLRQRERPDTQTRRLVRQLERLGHTVTLAPLEAAA